MKKIKLIFVLSFMCLIVNEQVSNAATGCFVSTQQVFAINPLGNINPGGGRPTLPTYSGSLSLNTSGQCPRVKSFSNPGSANSCYIRTGSSPNYSYASGTLFDYVIENCPIDDYIPFLILFTGGLGFLYIRRTSMLKVGLIGFCLRIK